MTRRCLSYNHDTPMWVLVLPDKQKRVLGPENSRLAETMSPRNISYLYSTSEYHSRAPRCVRVQTNEREL